MATGQDTDRVARHTVFVADDDEDFRAALADALHADGYDVVAVESGAGVLALLERAAKGRAPKPDLLVLDLLMPNVSGLELLQKLRKSSRWGALPVLVVTGLNDPMLPVRLDVPIAFKPDIDAVLASVRHRLADPPAAGSAPGAQE
jgi:CheY-like chemotaxis protein